MQMTFPSREWIKQYRLGEWFFRGGFQVQITEAAIAGTTEVVVMMTDGKSRWQGVVHMQSSEIVSWRSFKANLIS